MCYTILFHCRHHYVQINVGWRWRRRHSLYITKMQNAITMVVVFWFFAFDRFTATTTITVGVGIIMNLDIAAVGSAKTATRDDTNVVVGSRWSVWAVVTATVEANAKHKVYNTNFNSFSNWLFFVSCEIVLLPFVLHILLNHSIVIVFFWYCRYYVAMVFDDRGTSNAMKVRLKVADIDTNKFWWFFKIICMRKCMKYTQTFMNLREKWTN